LSKQPHRGPSNSPGMTDHEILMEMHLRLYTLEGACEKMAAQQMVMTRNQRMLIEHAQRLLHAKELLLAALGRVAYTKPSIPTATDLASILAQQTGVPYDSQTQADIDRARREMGH
jgi:hypothetical protein